MSGFWNKLKALFVGPSSTESDPLAAAVKERMIERARAGRGFRTSDIAAEMTRDTQGPQVHAQIDQIANLVEELFARGVLRPFHYERSWTVAEGRPGWFLHPAHKDIAGSPSSPDQSEANPYEGNRFLGLTEDEVREALMKRRWYRSLTDATSRIPSRSDLRAVLIDRALLLRGLLTQAEIDEIHDVGEQFLRYENRYAFALAEAARTADQALALLHEERARLKKAKQEESLRRREARQTEIQRRRKEDIVFLGRGVSKGLADRRSNIEALQAAGLPLLSAPRDVAVVLGMTVPRLRWLTFHSDAAERTHYVHFDVAKRSGGTRRLSAPHRQLRTAQTWVLRNILEKIAPSDIAHGFVKGRSTVTNAREHLRRPVVVNLDLEDFFPSITFPRVRGLFAKLGYSPAVSTILALLCTESPRQPLIYDGKTYQVAVGTRSLPQGACTSPAISNLVVRSLDKRIIARAGKLGWHCTRYADDLTFSVEKPDAASVGMIMAAARHIIDDEGFRLNPAKGRVQRKGGRQTVTGIVVNEKTSVPRDEVRRIRAVLHQAKKTGLEAQNREQRPNFRSWLEGKIAYIRMVDAVKGARLQAELDALSTAR